MNNIKVLIPFGSTRTAEVAARALLSEGVQIILGRPEGAPEPRLLKAGACEGTIHPSPSKDYYPFMAWLENWMMENSKQLVLPIDEAVIHAVKEIRAKNPAELTKSFICPPDSSLHYSLSKYYSVEAAQRAGIPIPKTEFVMAPGSDEFVVPVTFKYPAILKWDNALFEGRYIKGGNRVVLSSQEVEDCCWELLPMNCGILLQELVSGSGWGDFQYRIDQQRVAHFQHQRVHEVPWTGGVSAMCRSVYRDDIATVANRFLDFIGFNGVAMVEFKGDENGVPFFMELNGRLWGSLGLALRSGMNFPKVILNAHQKGSSSSPSTTYQVEVYWHDPLLQKLYWKSLFSPSKVFRDSAPKMRGGVRVISAFFNPRVHSEWWRWSEPILSLRAYLSILRSEVSVHAQKMRSILMKRKIGAMWASAEQRTRRFEFNTLMGKSILFVCFGNICRSPYAEYRWNEQYASELSITAASTGFYSREGRSTPKRFESVARFLGVDLANHRSKQITLSMVKQSEVIFIMDMRNLKDMHENYPEHINKVLLLGACANEGDSLLPDPYDGQIGAGAYTYRRIDHELFALAKRISQVL